MAENLIFRIKNIEIQNPCRKVVKGQFPADAGILPAVASRYYFFFFRSCFFSFAPCCRREMGNLTQTTQRISNSIGDDRKDCLTPTRGTNQRGELKPIMSSDFDFTSLFL